jgi:hypothetical protein
VNAGGCPVAGGWKLVYEEQQDAPSNWLKNSSFHRAKTKWKGAVRLKKWTGGQPGSRESEHGTGTVVFTEHCELDGHDLES